MYKYSLTEGKIGKSLLYFAIPLFFSNLFQQLYNTIDIAIVGRYLGDLSLATMGATTAIYDLMIGFAQGIGTGFSIVSARYYGSKQQDHLKKSVATGIILLLITSLILTLLFYNIMPILLSLLNTPSSLIKEALSYIQIIAIFITIPLFYNYSAGLLRAIGDSITPLFVLFIASILNIILDILFIKILKMGVEGAAIATMIAQFCALFVCIVCIFKKASILIPNKEHYKIDKDMIIDMSGQGYSMAMMFSIVSIGTITLQSAINTLGTVILAAHASARKMISLLNLPLSTLCATMSTFVSQNKGAKRYDRIKEGIRIANTIGIIYAFIISIVVFLFSENMIQILSSTTENEIIKNGSMYLKINVPFLSVLTVLLNLRNALQGLGKKITPLISSIIELIGKLIFTYIVIQPMQYLGVCICEPIIWILMTIQLLYSFYLDENIKAQN